MGAVTGPNDIPCLGNSSTERIQRHYARWLVLVCLPKVVVISIYNPFFDEKMKAFQLMGENEKAPEVSERGPEGKNQMQVPRDSEGNHGVGR